MFLLLTDLLLARMCVHHVHCVLSEVVLLLPRLIDDEDDRRRGVGHSLLFRLRDQLKVLANDELSIHIMSIS